MIEPLRQRIGVLGAGQLALMLAEASHVLDIEVFCAGQPGDCAERAAPLTQIDLNNPIEVAAFAAQVDRVTIESENIDASVLQGLNLFPNTLAIGIAQDRLTEKHFFTECGIGTAPFAPIDRLHDLEIAVNATGLPAILKTRRMGYDGKGQYRIHTHQDLASAWRKLGEVPCILEGMVPFEAEVSLIAARGTDGAIVFYPLIQNYHREGILRVSIAPFVDGALQSQAELYLTTLLERLRYVGILTVEFFVVGGVLLANEMAPRVHNSGHWTIEGAQTSQFENHLRAIAGLTLGDTRSEPTVMLNCIGTMPPIEDTIAFPSLTRHDYGKDARPGRKVGHLTFPAHDQEAIACWQERLEENG